MGKLIVEQIVSVDGFAARADGDIEYFSAAGDFAATEPDQLAMLATCDAILLGATTYRMFADYWPTADPQIEHIATPINSLPKHVVSSTLAEAPWGEHPPAILERGDGVEIARRLKGQYDGDIVLWGSLTLADALFAAGLVDQLRLRIVPVLIGTGRSLAATALPGQLMRLTAVTSYDDEGHVGLVYDLAANAR